MIEAEPVGSAPGAAELGEGPLWDPSVPALWWVDILPGEIHRYEPITGTSRRWRVGQFVSALATMPDGRLLAAIQSGFAVFDSRSGNVELLRGLEQDIPTNRFNDGRVDGAGRFWAGTMHVDGVGVAGTLYRLDPDLRCTPMVDHVSISNGIGWSPDNRLLYYVDTPTGRVDVFDFDVGTGTIGGRRTFVRIPPDSGSPDGISVDAEGHVWVALFGGWAVHRYAPDGRMSGGVRLPVSNVTSCTFGGPGLDTLYITTATDGLTMNELTQQPFAGALFAARPGVSGQLATTFGWSASADSASRTR